MDTHRPNTGELDIVYTLHSVSKIYKEGKHKNNSVGTMALNKISIHIDRGEYLVITGKSGSGKSTLLHLLGGLDIPTTGRVIFYPESENPGKNLNAMNETQRARLRATHIGVIYQSFHLIPTLTALENVALPLVFKGIPIKERINRAKNELEALNLGERLQHFPSQLSGGEQQRVAVARALVMNPQILLADEPTGNLDTVSENEILEILEKLHNSKNLTVILVTHNEKIINGNMRRHIITMEDGETIKVNRRPSYTNNRGTGYCEMPGKGGR